MRVQISSQEMTGMLSVDARRPLGCRELGFQNNKVAPRIGESARIGITALLIGHTPQLAGVVILSIAELLKLAVYVMVFSIFIRALLSWISMGRSHPMLQLLYSFTEPLMAPARRILPAMGGLDLSPIIAFIVLMLILKLLVQPLLDLGRILV